MTDIDQEKELKVGDHIIYENPAKYEEGNNPQAPVDENHTIIPSISIEVLEVAAINKHKTHFCTTNDRINLPIYRIKHVIKPKGEGDNTLHPFPGYDFHAIGLEEGRISKETYDKIKALELERKKAVMETE